MKETKHFINGEYASFVSGNLFDNGNLANGQVIAKIREAGEAEVDAATKYVHEVSLELAGKNAGIVFADADLDKAIEGTLRSVFTNCDQVCLGSERIYVERPIFDEFVVRLKAGAEALVIGEPNDPKANFGPLASHKHREKAGCTRWSSTPN